MHPSNSHNAPLLLASDTSRKHKLAAGHPKTCPDLCFLSYAPYFHGKGGNQPTWHYQQLTAPCAPHLPLPLQMSRSGMHKLSLKVLMVVALAAICLLLVAPGAGATSRILLDNPPPAANTTNTTNTTAAPEAEAPVAVDVLIPVDPVVWDHAADLVPNMALAWAPGVMDHPDMMAKPMFEVRAGLSGPETTGCQISDVEQLA